MLNEGFAEYKPNAINLLKTTINILTEFDIKHFLISGTLLGFVRHNDFIPWDDDIDLLVDESILKKLDKISEKYPNLNIFQIPSHKYNSIKVCFSDGLEIPQNSKVEIWKKNAISKSNNYTWPFIDLFVYEKGPGLHNCNSESTKFLNNQEIKLLDPLSGQCSETFRLFTEKEISFFHNEWDSSEFFPPKKVSFLGIDCNIPKNPDYFLSINYGQNYMTEIKKPIVIHKTEQYYDNRGY